MSNRHAAKPAAALSPAAPRPGPHLLSPRAARPLSLRRLASVTTALSMICTPEQYCRFLDPAAAQARLPIPPALVLLRATGQSLAPAGDGQRAIARAPRRDWMHREAPVA
jgi:hypothetical protein